jgi:serine/threonine protein kinase/formylglycine-generating enzyme required for sulfatase activity
MGTVYLAHDELLDRAVAIKFLSIPQANSAQRARFLTEARALARLHHPNIVAVYRTGEYLGQPYLVSEYVRGLPLSQLTKPLPAEQVRQLAIGLCRGLAAAHRSGVLHRDIKPANAIRAEDGEVKLLDFGLAKLTLDQRPATLSTAQYPYVDADGPRPVPSATVSASSHPVMALDATASLDESTHRSDEAPETAETPATPVLLATQAGARLGTPLYMAPELWRGEPATVRSDLYALGALLYELACGRTPHLGSDLSSLEQAVLREPLTPLCERASGFDAALATLIEGCLRKTSGERPSSAAQFLSELEGTLFRGQPLPVSDNPYRGLLPFDAEHRAFFVGRGAEVRHVVEQFHVSSLVVISGSSGVGKSSLCRAGVVPSIIEGALGDHRDWQAIRMVPGKRPLLALAGGLAPYLGHSSEETRILAENDPAGLVRALLLKLEGAAQEGERKRGLLLFVDQLEELVSQSQADEALSFGSFLSELSTPLPALRVLLSVRGDFLFSVMEATGLHQELAQALYVLPPLSSAALEAVIAEPAHVCGFGFEDPAQIRAMAESAAQAEGGLPLLQFALAELWELRDRNRKLIPAQALHEIGGVAGALARHADGIMRRLSPSEHQAAHRLLARLVTSSGTRAARPQEDLVTGSPLEREAAAGALEALVRARLLVARQSPVEGAVYEIAHEALLQGWGTLRDLLSQDAERRAVTERLEQAAAEWTRLDHTRQALWQDRQLAELEAVRIKAEDLPSRLALFVTVSRRAARRQRLLRYSLPAVAILALVGGERDVRWYSGRPAIAKAEQFLKLGHAMRAETAKLQAQAYSLFDEREIKRGNEVYTQALSTRQESLRLYQQAQSDANGALTLRPTRAAALIQRSIREQEVLLRAFPTGAPADQDSDAPARVTLRIWPEGATVSMQRADGNLAHRGWLAEEQFGTTPVVDKAVPKGSYLLTIRAPGRVTTPYPIYLYAGESFSAEFTLPTPAQVQDGMVYIPPGRFLYGCGEAEEIREWLGAQPIHPVWTAGYLIARHETTYGEWIEFLEALPDSQRDAFFPQATGENGPSVKLERLAERKYRLTLRPHRVNTLVAETGQPIRYPQRARRQEQDWYKFPVSGISREDAEAYTQWLDKSGRLPGARLCTEHEWERAARGADNRIFPSGDILEPDDANIDVTYGREPSSYGPDVVGSHLKSNSVFGLFDMAGNVREWTKSTERKNDFLYRDGSFFHTMRTSRSANRQVGAAALRNILIGFRICH